MKLDKLRSGQSPRLMIIPMIDIIFFLLVFFMMSTLYMVEQNVIPVALPQASAAQADTAALVPITVTAHGKILVGREEISSEMVRQRVAAEISRSPEAAFVLRGDRGVEYGRVIWLLDELKHCGVRRISVATETKP